MTEIAEHMGHSVAVLARDYAQLIADMGEANRPTSVTDAIMSARTDRARTAR